MTASTYAVARDRCYAAWRRTEMQLELGLDEGQDSDRSVGAGGTDGSCLSSSPIPGSPLLQRPGSHLSPPTVRRHA